VSKRWRICVEGGLLSGRFRLVLKEVFVTDPELTAPGGLYVYLQVCGVNNKGGLVPSIRVHFCIQGLNLSNI